MSLLLNFRTGFKSLFVTTLLLATSACGPIEKFLGSEKDKNGTIAVTEEQIYGMLKGLHTGATAQNASFPVSTVSASNINVTLRRDVLISVIDSGVDYSHNDLRSLMWRNPAEIENNNVDDDRNNFIDDIFGWNFVNNNNQIIDYQYQSRFTADVRRFMEISAKRAKGTATSEENNWFSSKRSDSNFMQQVEVFANYSHGTHVAGISSYSNPKARLSGLKMIGTEQNKVASVNKNALAQISSTIQPTGTLETILIIAAVGAIIALLLGGGGLGDIGGGVGGGGGGSASFEPIFTYAEHQGAAVANCSFGVTASSVQSAMNNYLRTQTHLKTNELNLINLAVQTTANIGDQMAADIAKAPHVLFVIAAGNEGANNDSTAAWPANVKAANTIAVAATLGRSRLAEFSNYGTQMVEVAAPGVAIRSTIPGNEYIEMSGTSMAAPYVTNVAAQVRSINPNLTPEQTKRVIMGTVDRKSFLSGKVSTGGIVNAKRAAAAAELSVSMELESAISQSMQMVGDETELNDVLVRSGSYSPQNAYVHSLIK